MGGVRGAGARCAGPCWVRTPESFLQRASNTPLYSASSKQQLGACLRVIWVPQAARQQTAWPSAALCIAAAAAATRPLLPRHIQARHQHRRKGRRKGWRSSAGTACAAGPHPAAAAAAWRACRCCSQLVKHALQQQVCMLRWADQIQRPIHQHQRRGRQVPGSGRHKRHGIAHQTAAGGSSGRWVGRGCGCGQPAAHCAAAAADAALQQGDGHGTHNLRTCRARGKTPLAGSPAPLLRPPVHAPAGSGR